MGILQQYIDDYSRKSMRASDEYSQGVDAYNASVKAFNDSLVLGPDGKPVVVQSHELGDRFATPLEGYDGFWQIRQNPTVAWEDKTFKKLGNPEYGYSYVYVDPKTAEETSLLPERNMVFEEAPGGMYRVGRASFPSKPGDPPTEPNYGTPPSFTNAQMKKLGAPDRSAALAGDAKSSDGIISKLLERKNDVD